MLKVNNMEKSSLLKILFFMFFLFELTTYAQKVSNITYRQEQSNIIVSYDLETKTPSKVSLFVSTNGGATWQGPLTKVTGDVGSKIVSGSHNITWNVLEEFEELRGDKIMFQVRAIGNIIETVKIGTQEWAVKNLDVSTYRNGDIIPEVKDPYKWEKLTTGAWCYYNNDPKNGAIYGKLYNWYAVNDPRGLVPEGFRVPTIIELKKVNFATFSSIPGGYRSTNGTFIDIGNYCFWWSLSKNDNYSAWSSFLNSSTGLAYRDYYNKKNGLSVRCLKD
jgi:hypothetical protein